MAYSDNFVDDLLVLVTDIVSGDMMELSNMLYEKSFGESSIADNHEIITGVRTGNVVPILKDVPSPDSFPFVDETSCATTECDITQEFSDFKWDLGLIECRVPVCLRTFNENFLRFFNVWRHTQEDEPDLNSAMIQFMTEKFNKNLLLSEWRATWFGDKASASAFYNGIDGFWTLAEAGAGANSVAITQNAGATFALQAVTGEEVYNYLIEMYDLASLQPWFDPSSLEYRITRSMSVKLVAFLNKLGKNAPMNCECIDPSRAVLSNVYMLEGLTINGIPVVTHSEFDDIINFSAELNGGGGVNARVNPNRAILTFRQNLLIGTSETDALNSLDVWYDKTDKKVYIEGSSYVGSALPMNEYILAI